MSASLTVSLQPCKQFLPALVENFAAVLVPVSDHLLAEVKELALQHAKTHYELNDGRKKYKGAYM